MLREIGDLTGITVDYLHFNEGGEGKRNLTDGHNAHLKNHRDAALRAGQPSECTTALREVEGAHYDGGLPGTQVCTYVSSSSCTICVVLSVLSVPYNLYYLCYLRCIRIL